MIAEARRMDREQRPYIVASAAKDPAHEVALTESYQRPDLVLTTNRTSYPIDGYDGLELALSDFSDTPVQYPFKEQEFQEEVLLGGENIGDNGRCSGFSESRKRFLKEICQRIDGESDGREVIVNPYSNNFGNSFFRERGYFVIGPSRELVERYDNKTNSYNMAKRLGIPVVEGGSANNLDEAREIYKELMKRYSSVFMSSSVNGGGGDTALRINGEGVDDFPGKPPYIITGWVDKLGSPSSQVLIGRDRVLYLGMGDQIIEGGVRYAGNLFPSCLPKEIQERIKRYSLKLANKARKEGFRGFKGFDWMNSKDEEFFSEDNPRKTRQTSIFIGYLNSIKPKDFPSFTELEILATENKPWGDIGDVEEWMPDNPVHWGTKVYMEDGNATITRSIDPEYTDNTIFLDSPKNGRSSVLNFPRKGVYLLDFGKQHSLARVIATGSDREQVLDLMDQESKRIQKSYKRLNPGDNGDDN